VAHPIKKGKKMKIYKKIKQGTEEWKQLRLGKFGSTDAQAVGANGRGLETACFYKASELLIGKGKEFYTNEDMERGKILEDDARTLYELETGNTVKQVGYVELDEYVGCSPDGLVGDDGLIEIKCPNNKVFVEYLFTGKIDTKYSWQMQFQMMVTNRGWNDYVLYNEDLNEIKITRVERDEKAIEKIKVGLKAGKEKIKNILEKIK
jgi:putative phage-type endonuclease